MEGVRTVTVMTGWGEYYDIPVEVPDEVREWWRKYDEPPVNTILQESEEH